MSPHQQCIQTAQGYCELGMWNEAWNELDTLPPEERAHPDVLHLRLNIYIALQRYEAAEILARSLVAKGDRHPSTWLNGAWAIRRHHSVAEAYAFLIEAEPFLFRHALYNFNLACYACQLGKLEEAKDRIERAITFDPTLKEKASVDPDLAPLWDSLATEL